MRKKIECKRVMLSVLLICSSAFTLLANGGYHIEINAPGYTGSEIYLAFYMGSNQYVADTARSDKGRFLFEGEEALAPGVYLIVFPPNNEYFQLFINENEQQITAKMDTSSMQRPVEITGSTDNQMFYDFTNFIADQKFKADSLKSLYEEVEEDQKEAIEQELTEVDRFVRDRQASLVAENPNSMTAIMIQSTREPQMPDFAGTEEEIQRARYLYYRNHYFDNIPLNDPRIVRTPFLYGKIEYYLDKLTMQTPDSIVAAVDLILSQFESGSEVFKVYLVTFLNKYAGSKVVGMDAVYVHLVDKYYANGMAPWTGEEQLKKIVDNANRLRPILIGQTAPDLKFQDVNNAEIRVHQIESPYTVLFFWDPDCGHCKESMPSLIEFYDSYAEKGVEILGICTKLGEEVSKCWDMIEEKGMDRWINATDPYLRSRFKQIYDIRTTPQIFILDDQKQIIMKRIGAEQLPDVMEQLMKQPENANE